MTVGERTKRCTLQELHSLPDDGNRYELIDGELFVTPTPSDVHQLVAAEFHARLREYLKGSPVARALFSPADVRKSDRTRNRVQPDVFAVRLIDGKRPPYPYSLSDLLLAIEVESPSNPELDYQVKRELYMAQGVGEYWIASADKRVVSRWRGRADPGDVLSGVIEWHPMGMANPLVIDLPGLFAEALS
jgi:Uma2 family endonuclease